MTRPAFVRPLLTVACAAMFVPGVAAAQTPAPARMAAPAADTVPLDDAHWAPWIGCWRSVNDPAGSGARLCVTPSPGGVATVTVIGGRAIADDVRIADGREHPIAEGDCRGTETAHWSTRALRLYRHATVSCAGEAPSTRASVSFFLPGPTWVDVETVTRNGDETNVRVGRYERAYDQTLPGGAVVPPPAATPPASLPRTTSWTVNDVLELHASLPADGVQAAISEAPAPFRLDARTLNALADAGVGERVIDLMVGVTYPHKFVVDRVVAGGGAGYGGPIGGLDPFAFAPMLGSMAFSNCYAPLGWAMPSYWASCANLANAYGYFPYGLYDPWGPGWVTIPGSSGGGGVSPTPGVEGRVVNGRGYTQVRPAEPLPAVGSGGGWSGASSPSGGNGGSGSGSSGVSSSGYSGGGSSSGGGGDRVAVPRPPGR